VQSVSSLVLSGRLPDAVAFGPTPQRRKRMSTLHDDEIRTITEGGRLDPQADTDGDDTDTTDGDATDTDADDADTDATDADADDSDA